VTLPRAMPFPEQVVEAPEAGARMPEAQTEFREDFVRVFDTEFRRLCRYIDRLSGDPDLAADVAQDAFVRLYQRGSLPDETAAWLLTVAMNLFRNVQVMRSRRRRLLTPWRMARAVGDPPPRPDERITSDEMQRRVRAALQRVSVRSRQLLLLRAEGYSYREMASALQLNDHSVGVLLARAKADFRAAYGGIDAP
jgi:RNA polymerase sigma factor (sigma-70 family)